MVNTKIKDMIRNKKLLKNKATNDFKITPWDVTGKVDYDKIVKEFGLGLINNNLLGRLAKLARGLHPLLVRKVFFSHRDMPWLLNKIESGNKFFLYTGRGPSERTHFGHLIPWLLTKWFQERFKVPLIFQFTDDEKYLQKQGLRLEKVRQFAIDNALDVIALGFNQKLTHFLFNTEHAGLLYPLALKVAKHVTFNTSKAVFGFNNSSNIGILFFTSMQAVPAMLPSVLANKNIPCLIPMGLDQDPHFRVARDVLPRLGFYKPACLYSKFLLGLTGSSKMSASKSPNDVLFLSDDLEVAERKLKNSFTGGRETAEKQKRLGGNPYICPIYYYYLFFFAETETDLEAVQQECLHGKRLCGDCKAQLIEKILKFLEKHQKARLKAVRKLEKYKFDEQRLLKTLI